jgi:hypothetical protein
MEKSRVKVYPFTLPYKNPNPPANVSKVSINIKPNEITGFFNHNFEYL